MSKRTFVIFGLLVVVLAVLIPWLAFRSRGDAETGAQQVPSNLKGGQALFQTNCGTCHTLYAAGTDGNYAPNLDLLLAPSGPPSGPTAQQTIKSTEGRVLNAVENGVDTITTPGRMPAGILNKSQAKEVAEFVAHTAGEG
ncbi:MAG TPA: c-type cytochrome [Solirubrobacterales bacterium]|jgi:mono/diheme cytochrome c family protein|nr:c-type cytochrome [Solirubrobacterales bacterium]